MPKDSKDFEFEKNIREQIELLNHVLGDVGAPGIFENPHIAFDERWCFERYLKFRISRQDNNSVTLDFHLMTDGMRLDFDHYQEAYEFSIENLDMRCSNIKETLKRLFSGPILVEYKGSAQFVNLFNDDGSRYAIWNLGSLLTLLTGTYRKSQEMRQHLFSPIYPRTESRQ